MARGKFIVFEGGGGTGKDTLIDLLKKRVADRTDILFTRDPGGTPFGEQIRELLLAKDAADIHPRTELLLFLATRTELVEKVIAPALEVGKTVVSNRFALSTIAYQIYGREQKENLMLVREALRLVTRGILPDLCILLDVAPEIARARAKDRGVNAHRFIDEDVAFQERVRDGYKRHAPEFARKTILIDTSGTIDEAWKKTEEALQSVFQGL